MTTPASRTPELSVVFPAYNEEGNIGAVLSATASYLDAAGIDFEIEVVDDGSRDGTYELVESRSARDPRVRVLRHARNLGYGAALRSGIARAQGRRILLSDADGQFSTDALEALWLRREEADVVLGYRNPRNDPWLRRVAGRLYRLLVRAVLGVRQRDVNCGVKLLHRSVVEGMPLASSGAVISAELLTRARIAGASFLDVPVEHNPRRNGRATGLLPRVVLRSLFELIAVRRSILRPTQRRPLGGLRAECDAVESRPS